MTQQSTLTLTETEWNAGDDKKVLYTVFREHGHVNGAATQPHARDVGDGRGWAGTDGGGQGRVWALCHTVWPDVLYVCMSCNTDQYTALLVYLARYT